MTEIEVPTPHAGPSSGLLTGTLLPSTRRPLGTPVLHHPGDMHSPSGATEVLLVDLGPSALDDLAPFEHDEDDETDVELTADELSGRVLPGGPLTPQERDDLARLGATTLSLATVDRRATDPPWVDRPSTSTLAPMRVPFGTTSIAARTGIGPAQPSRHSHPSDGRRPSHTETDVVIRAGDDRLGLSVVHRRLVPRSAPRHTGESIDPSFVLSCFGDVATELCIRTDSDEGLLTAYADVRFLAPVNGADVLEVTATLVGLSAGHREIRFEAHVLCRATPERGLGASAVLAERLLVTTATGTATVPGCRP